MLQRREFTIVMRCYATGPMSNALKDLQSCGEVDVQGPSFGPLTVSSGELVATTDAAVIDAKPTHVLLFAGGTGSAPLDSVRHLCLWLSGCHGAYACALSCRLSLRC